jgi:hypothetical protein
VGKRFFATDLQQQMQMGCNQEAVLPYCRKDSPMFFVGSLYSQKG